MKTTRDGTLTTCVTCGQTWDGDAVRCARPQLVISFDHGDFTMGEPIVFTMGESVVAAELREHFAHALAGPLVLPAGLLNRKRRQDKARGTP